MSVATFMRACLTHPLGGYYLAKPHVFGHQGDFITSPEISQVFGELMAIWYTTQVLTSAKAKEHGAQVIEFGPGKGTLMADMLKTWRQLQGMQGKIKSVHLIEASENLQKAQAQALGVEWREDVIRDGVTKRSGTTVDGIKVCWHEHLEDVPRGPFSMIMAHEFFDALPIYRFEKTSEGWREIMVDWDDTPERYIIY
jgi:NADH dehydrogenase [ubiquinone] 1 alpha subcomplex assembly factor 7